MSQSDPAWKEQRPLKRGPSRDWPHTDPANSHLVPSPAQTPLIPNQPCEQPAQIPRRSPWCPLDQHPWHRPRCDLAQASQHRPYHPLDPAQMPITASTNHQHSPTNPKKLPPSTDAVICQHRPNTPAQTLPSPGAESPCSGPSSTRAVTPQVCPPIPHKGQGTHPTHEDTSLPGDSSCKGNSSLPGGPIPASCSQVSCSPARLQGLVPSPAAAANSVQLGKGWACVLNQGRRSKKSKTGAEKSSSEFQKQYLAGEVGG